MTSFFSSPKVTSVEHRVNLPDMLHGLELIASRVWKCDRAIIRFAICRHSLIQFVEDAIPILREFGFSR